MADVEEPLPAISLTLDLEETGDSGSSFRTKNAPGSDFRRGLIDRGKTLALQADLATVTHGHLSPDGAYGTLLVFDLQFISLNATRRFKSAMVQLHFAAEEPGANEPEVINVSPKSHQTLDPTARNVVQALTGNMGVTGGPPGGVVAITGGGTVSRTTTVDHTDGTILTGSARLEGRNYGGKNVARWSLTENPSQKAGIPSFVRTAVLLKRKSEDRFVMKIEIKAKVDMVSAMKEVWGGTEKDDPVTFDPVRDGAGDKVPFDLENLESVDLKALSGIVSTTVVHTIVGADPPAAKADENN